MMGNRLKRKIESLAQELQELYKEGAIADNPKLVKKSQELDKYILKYQKLLSR